MDVSYDLMIRYTKRYIFCLVEGKNSMKDMFVQEGKECKIKGKTTRVL